MWNRLLFLMFILQRAGGTVRRPDRRSFAEIWTINSPLPPTVASKLPQIMLSASLTTTARQRRQPQAAPQQNKRNSQPQIAATTFSAIRYRFGAAIHPHVWYRMFHELMLIPTVNNPRTSAQTPDSDAVIEFNKTV